MNLDNETRPTTHDTVRVGPLPDTKQKLIDKVLVQLVVDGTYLPAAYHFGVNVNEVLKAEVEKALRLKTIDQLLEML